MRPCVQSISHTKERKGREREGRKGKEEGREVKTITTARCSWKSTGIHLGAECGFGTILLPLILTFQNLCHILNSLFSDWKLYLAQTSASNEPCNLLKVQPGWEVEFSDRAAA
jgi:hypothetical protein